MRQAAAQGVGRHVDQLDLIGAVDEGVGDRVTVHARDPGDDVVERLELADVERGDHVDAGVEDRLHVLPTVSPPTTGWVGPTEVVDECDGRPAVDHRGGVHRPLQRFDARQTVGARRRVAAPVVVEHGQDDVGAAFGTAVTLVEHGERLAHAGRSTEVDAQCARAAPSVWP